MSAPDRAGVALIAASAAAFGAMAIFARHAYAGGADVHGVLLARFALAGTLLAAVLVAARRPWPRGRALAVAIGMGAVGYAGQAALYFTALQHASAGLVALLLYAYPTLVALLAAAFLGEKLTRRRAALLAMGFAGIALTLGGGGGTPLGFALALGAALVYSVYIVVGARELKGVDALASSTVICLAGAATFAAAALVHAPRLPKDAAGWTAVAAIALVSTVVAILAFFAGLKRVGAATASMLSTLEPVVTVALAWVFLGEAISWLQALGGIIVLAAAIRLARPGPAGT